MNSSKYQIYASVKTFTHPQSSDLTQNTKLFNTKNPKHTTSTRTWIKYFTPHKLK